MARKLSIKDVEMINPLNGQEQVFSYGEMMLAILRLAPQGRGMSYEDVEAAMDAVTPIKQAIEDKAETITLTESQYKTLLDKLREFQFSVATEEIVTFGRMIRNAPEIGTESGEVTTIRRA